MKGEKLDYWGMILFLIIAGLLMSHSVAGQDKWDRVIDLGGKWKFSIGDKPAWAEPGFNDSGWEDIYVPSKWEDEGFNGYNGFAWYRRTFNGAEIKSKGQGFNLFLGYIDDVDEVFINGRKVGSSGAFPPRYHTSYNTFRNYYVEPSLINFSGKNVIAVRVYDAEIEGGIISGEVGVFVNRSETGLAVNLRGTWDFRLTGKHHEKNPVHDEKMLVALTAKGGQGWIDVSVPNHWENQGFPDYDGSAWYRKAFTIPKTLAGEDLVIVLGKIDDSDKTYLNGKLVGSTINEHERLRVYFISPTDYKAGEVNTLLVWVDDPQGAGGIWEGPVGLMKQSDFTRFMRWR